MKKLHKLVALTAAMAMFSSPVYSQECCDGIGYEDCCDSSNMSVWLPIGALVVAGIIIATTHRHHHHSSSSSSSSHAHFTTTTSIPFTTTTTTTTTSF